MRKPALPRRLDARKMCHIQAQVEASEPVAAMPRLVAGLADDRGEVSISLSFFRDESGRRRIGGVLSADVALQCHRCHGAIATVIDTRFDYVLALGGAELPPDLPAELDGLEIEGDELAPLALIEDELIIATPYASYHDDKGCAKATDLHYEAAVEAADDSDTRRPFAGLAELLNKDKP